MLSVFEEDTGLKRIQNWVLLELVMLIFLHLPLGIYMEDRLEL